MYDVTDYGLNLSSSIQSEPNRSLDTFSNARLWSQEINQKAPANVKKLLVGKNSDLTANKVVEYTTAKVLPFTSVHPFSY